MIIIELNIDKPEIAALSNFFYHLPISRNQKNAVGLNYMDWFFYALACAVFSSCSTLIEKKALFTVHAVEYSLIVAVFNVVLAVPFFFFASFSTVSLPIALLILALAVLNAISFISIAHGIRHTEISATSPLLVLSPALTGILAFAFLNEALSILQVSGIALLIVGVYILELKPHHGLLNPFRELFISPYSRSILFGIGLYGVSAFFDRLILSRFSIPPVTYLALMLPAIGIAMILVGGVYGYSLVRAFKGFGENGKLLTIPAAFFMIGYRFAQIQAVALAFVAPVLAIKRISSFFTTLVGGELFHEKDLPRKLVATALMITGVIFLIP